MIWATALLTILALFACLAIAQGTSPATFAYADL